MKRYFFDVLVRYVEADGGADSSINMNAAPHDVRETNREAAIIMPPPPPPLPDNCPGWAQRMKYCEVCLLFSVFSTENNLSAYFCINNATKLYF